MARLRGIYLGNLASAVTVVIGADAIAQAIVRRVGAGKIVVLTDVRNADAELAAKVLRDAGFDARSGCGGSSLVRPPAPRARLLTGRPVAADANR